jgi:putative heme-binding domain-containing protein
VREEALAALLARPERSLALLGAIERGELPAGQLGLARKTQLLASTNAAVKQLAERTLKGAEEARAAVVDRYSAALGDRGDRVRGREVFVQHCAACPRADGVGVEIGPHMETVRSWDRSKLLLNVLDPSREVAPQSMSYAIVLVDGRVINGLIADETASSLTIKRAGAQPETVLREDIEQMSNSGVSLMPVGFEESISPTAMADLLAFLQAPPGGSTNQN